MNKQKEKGEVLTCPELGRRSPSKGQAQHQNLGTTTKLSAGHGKFDTGQAMVEAMVALSVIVVALLSVFTLTTQSLGLNRVAADRYVAVNLANEGIELVKNLIDNNEWNAIPGFNNSTSQYEIDYNDLAVKSLDSDRRFLYFSKDGSGYYAYDDGDLDLSVYILTVQDLTRIINIENVDENSEHKKVVSTVFWKAKDGATLSFFVEDHFYKGFEL